MCARTSPNVSEAVRELRSNESSGVDDVMGRTRSASTFPETDSDGRVIVVAFLMRLQCFPKTRGNLVHRSVGFQTTRTGTLCLLAVCWGGASRNQAFARVHCSALTCWMTLAVSVIDRQLAPELLGAMGG
jgi:hypothetical protein